MKSTIWETRSASQETAETALADRVRTFVAINLPEHLLSFLGELQQRLQSGLPKETVRWVPNHQIHLTLKFLGHLAGAGIEPLAATLEGVCRAAAPLRLRAEGVGCFPGPSRPRVIWVGMGGDLEQLLALQSQIDPAVQPWCERKEDRRFRPHLTIGRVREVSPRLAREVGSRLRTAGIESLGEWQAEQVCLMRSRLSPAGAEHSILATLPLLGPGSSVSTHHWPVEGGC